MVCLCLDYFSIKKEVRGDMQDGIVKLTKPISVINKEIYKVNVTVTDGKNSNQVKYNNCELQYCMHSYRGH